MDAIDLGPEPNSKPITPWIVWIVWIVWIAWAVMSGSFFVCWLEVQVLQHPPDLAHLFVFMVTHSVGVFATLLISIFPSQHRRMPEFWALFVYGAIVAAFLNLDDRAHRIELQWEWAPWANAVTCVVLFSGLVCHLADGDRARSG